MVRINVKPQGFVGRMRDKLIVPLRYLLSGSFFTLPKRTHRWNCMLLKHDEVEYLRRDLMVYSEGVGSRTSSSLKKKHYVVLRPSGAVDALWHIGWITDTAIVVSRIPVRGPVRILRDANAAWFFGVDAQTSLQTRIHDMGNGTIGDKGPFSHKPLI